MMVKTDLGVEGDEEDMLEILKNDLYSQDHCTGCQFYHFIVMVAMLLEHVSIH
jgi:hypothetical protein